ncbi:unnamed protein product [Pedinophyceae sp. YPF-701]|nr:unnamed protein product [Pedinophyceae sp. YPF-701]
MTDSSQQVIKVARRIYVGNLSWSTTWQGLKDYFKEVGSVKYAEVLTGHDGRSKGCGIVEFEQPEEAARAIRELNDTEVNGRRIYVREDREDRDLKEYYNSQGGAPPRGAGREGPPKRARYESPASRSGYESRRVTGSRGGRSPRGRDVSLNGGDTVTIGRRVYVHNLPHEVDWRGLKDHFRQCGSVVYADVLPGARGCAIVEYERAEEALRAISHMNNTVLGGRQIHVREDREDRDVNRSAAPAGKGSLVAGAAGRQIVVHGLPWAVDTDAFGQLLSDAGEVERAEVMRESSGRSKGWGIAVFVDSETAQKAIDMFNGYEYDGRMLTAKLDQYASD